PDPAATLREAWRVLAPSGRVVLVGQDWDAFVIDSDEPAVTRLIVHASADRIPSPRTARTWRSVLVDLGFRDGAVEVHTGLFTDAMAMPMLGEMVQAARRLGAVNAEQADRWIEEQAERVRSGRFFLAVPIFLASATRP
nr:SAM-dependent methyltransferase [Micromonospora sp. DSM 115978]